MSYPKNIQNVKNINLIIFYSNNILQYEKCILWKRNITNRKKISSKELFKNEKDKN